METCKWVAETNSSRAWFEPVAHPGEDSESRSVRQVWSYCQYCGKFIEFIDRKGVEP